ncbi:hypothetical protein VR7878_03837 [Vibrio ruber DSM 16370]|uniref:DUF945 domain-containing protein n=1 Tax=Vibrio ruber (strain DSM 16370 / JCM 11486 / BCRC 17186 / CECT 7878 / LMG 23124 / VR1) TaxID=1123498 RepID=A0A1R4LUD2_VIBR1|nr:DUF945 family protein [Vibrio ruber]SJN59937.1 hypothetical protein VR7878_03837 [Vibrio ruber DSM 16370]
MNQLKKVAAVGGAVCLMASWPLVVGQIAERVFKDNIANIDNQLVSAKVLTYDRGYLSSHVQTEIQVTDPGLKAQMQNDDLPTSWVLNSDVKHGLFSIDAITQLDNQPEKSIKIVTQTQLNGNTHFEVDSQVTHYQGNTWSMTFTPISLSGDVTTLGEIDYRLDIPSMQFSNNELQIQLNNLYGNGQGKKEKGFWIGSQTLQVDKMVMSDDSGLGDFTLENVGYQNTSSMDADRIRYDTRQQFNIAKIAAQDGVVEHLNVIFSMGQLDVDSLAQIAEILEHYADITPADAQNLQQAFDRLVAKGFSVALEQLDIGLAQGQIESKVDLKLPQDTQETVQDPLEVVKKLTGHVESQVPKAVADAFPVLRQSVDELVTMQMMQEQGDAYRMDATVQDGELVFASGKKVPLMVLLMSAMMQM